MPDPLSDEIYFNGPLALYAYAGHDPLLYVDPDGRSFLNSGCLKLVFWTVVDASSLGGFAGAVKTGIQQGTKLASSVMNFKKNLRGMAGDFARGGGWAILGFLALNEIKESAEECGEKHGLGDFAAVEEELLRQGRWLLKKCKQDRDPDACKALKRACDRNNPAGPTLPEAVCREYREAKEKGELPVHMPVHGIAVISRF
jgi:hypothetical protein